MFLQFFKEVMREFGTLDPDVSMMRKAVIDIWSEYQLFIEIVLHSIIYKDNLFPKLSKGIQLIFQINRCYEVVIIFEQVKINVCSSHRGHALTIWALRAILLILIIHRQNHPFPTCPPCLPFHPFLGSRPYRPFLPYRGILPFLPFLPCLPYLPCLPFLRSLDKKIVTLHLRWIDSSKSLLAIFFLLIFVDPFGPIDIDILIFILILEKSRPEWSIAIMFFEYKEKMEACFSPLGFLLVDGRVKFERESIFMLVTIT